MRITATIRLQQKQWQINNKHSTQNIQIIHSDDSNHGDKTEMAHRKENGDVLAEKWCNIWDLSNKFYSLPYFLFHLFKKEHSFQHTMCKGTYCCIRLVFVVSLLAFQVFSAFFVVRSFFMHHSMVPMQRNCVCPTFRISSEMKSYRYSSFRQHILRCLLNCLLKLFRCCYCWLHSRSFLTRFYKFSCKWILFCAYEYDCENQVPMEMWKVSEIMHTKYVWMSIFLLP